jgi:hypothetical protein
LRSLKLLPNGSALPSYLLALAMGLLFAFWLFPVDFILGEGPHWAAQRSKDRMQNIIGMRYFLADEWRFPLFQTRLIAPPEGTNIIYTDSLPLFALIAKLLRPWLTEQVNYLGIWLFLSYVLQSIAAVFLLRSLDVKSVVPNLAGVVIALSFPAWLFRFGHAALSGHFLLLFALGFYFRSVRQQGFGRLWRWLALLCGLALLVHFYLFVMVLGVFLAAAAQEALFSRTRLWKSLVAGATVLGLSGLLMWVSGYFHGVGGVGGFGYYSMNVLSPWIPQQSGFSPAMNRIIDGTGGQYEGFNYLGLGVLLLLATALWAGRCEITSALRTYWGLVLLGLVLTLLAHSHRVFVGKWEVLTIGGSAPWVLQQLRSSGRFFWPVGYTLMAIGLAIASRRLRQPLNITLILAAAVLQFVDASSLRNTVTASANSGGQFSAPVELWRALIAAHESLTILPSFDCSGAWKSPARQYVLDLVFHASSSATPVNTAYLARGPVVDCDQESRSLHRRDLGEGELLVILSPPLTKMHVIEIPDSKRLCRSFAGGFACSRHWPFLEERLAAGFSDPVTYDLDAKACDFDCR